MAQTGSSEKTPHDGRLTRKIKALNSFVDLAAPGLDPTEFRIWVTLFRHERNGLVTRSQGLLAKDVGVCDRTIRRVVGRLIAKGLLLIVTRGTLRSGASTYRLGVKDLRKATAMTCRRPTPESMSA